MGRGSQLFRPCQRNAGRDSPKPLVFLKSSACLTNEKKIELPHFSNEVHHEVELAVQLGDKLEPLRVALALDLTARDHQTQAKQKGLPWTLAKSFRHSCPISPWINYQSNEWFEQLEFSLEINSEIRQQGRAKDMIFSLPILIRYLNDYFPVNPGDIILTGTPAGVGPLNSGDQLVGKINHNLDHSWEIF